MFRKYANFSIPIKEVIKNHTVIQLNTHIFKITGCHLF